MLFCGKRGAVSEIFTNFGPKLYYLYLMSIPKHLFRAVGAVCLLASSMIYAADRGASKEAGIPLYKDSKAPLEARVADLLGRMTLEEKAGQLVCPLGWEMYEKLPDGTVRISERFRQMNSGGMPVGSYWAVLRADPWTQKTLENGLSPRQGAEALNAMQRFAVDSTRLGIPILFAEEAPHGHMAIGTTVFPTGLGMASTWNPDLLRAAGVAVGDELEAVGAGVGYGPVMDIARDPRWSRMEESFGEDPYLTGVMATAYMDGMQRGADPGAEARVFSTLKHFAGYGVPESGHNGAPTSMGPIQLLSQNLPQFKMAVKQGVGSIMTSYNTVDGVPSTGNRFLLTDILRERWGLDGVIFSDLYSIDGMVGQVAADKTEAGAVALKSGVDIDLGANCYGARTLEALQRGLITEADLDRAVAEVLRMKFRLGLFENPYVDPAKTATRVRTAENISLAREVARQGSVLLKNDGVLPLSKDLKRIAVIGPNADMQYNQLGDYTAPQPEESVVTVLEGIREAVSPSTEVIYARGCAIRDTTASDIAGAVEAARRSDAVVLVLGGSSGRDFKTKYIETGAAEGATAEPGLIPDMDCGEGMDRSTLDLLGDQNRLLEAVLQTGKPVVVVYIQGRTLDMNAACEGANALLTAWYPGGEGGHGVADILFGDYNPSGRLPVSIPRSVGQLPVYYSQSIQRDYIDAPGSPLYPFGYGLGYTTFEYSDLSVKPATEPGALLEVTANVRNTGEREGTETAQLYIHDMVASVAQPPLLLKGFRQVSLKPGEQKVVRFLLGADELSVINPALEEVVEPGEFIIFVGSSSEDLHLKERVRL